VFRRRGGVAVVGPVTPTRSGAVGCAPSPRGQTYQNIYYHVPLYNPLVLETFNPTNLNFFWLRTSVVSVSASTLVI
jgi:hypothetical protein